MEHVRAPPDRILERALQFGDVSRLDESERHPQGTCRGLFWGRLMRACGWSDS